jgi:hypothetical protein
MECDSLCSSFKVRDHISYSYEMCQKYCFGCSDLWGLESGWDDNIYRIKLYDVTAASNVILKLMHL